MKPVLFMCSFISEGTAWSLVIIRASLGCLFFSCCVVKLVLDDGESHIMTTLNEPDIPAINKLPGIPQGESAEKIIEAEVSYLST